MKPVMLPPGFAKLVTNPLPIGSDAANTIGIVLVSPCSAAVAGVVKVLHRLGLRARHRWRQHLRVRRSLRHMP
jgi:hypothetical protein